MLKIMNKEFLNPEETITIPKGRHADMDCPTWYDHMAGHTFKVQLYRGLFEHSYYWVSDGEHKGKIIYTADIS